MYKSLEELEETAGSLKGMALRIRATSKGKFTATTIVPTGTRVKINGYELIDAVDKLGPTDRDGILEMLTRSYGEDDDDAFSDAKVDAAAKKAADKKAAAETKAPAKAPAKAAKETKAPVEPEDDEEATETGEDADPWD